MTQRPKKKTTKAKTTTAQPVPLAPTRTLDEVRGILASSLQTIDGELRATPIVDVNGNAEEHAVFPPTMTEDEFRSLLPTEERLQLEFLDATGNVIEDATRELRLRSRPPLQEGERLPASRLRLDANEIIVPGGLTHSQRAKFIERARIRSDEGSRADKAAEFAMHVHQHALQTMANGVSSIMMNMGLHDERVRQLRADLETQRATFENLRFQHQDEIRRVKDLADEQARRLRNRIDELETELRAQKRQLLEAQATQGNEKAMDKVLDLALEHLGPELLHKVKSMVGLKGDVQSEPQLEEPAEASAP